VIKSNNDRDSDSCPVTMALRPREAAAALGISERLLWTMTKAGEVPHVRFGRAIVYPVAKLEEWLQGKIGTEKPAG